jgi:NAD(P)-dependent dehydrogenase (short-subunit alcohol dehydrogenase family)
MKKVIITGAGGSLGIAAMKVFLEAGYKVIATVTNVRSKSILPHHANIEEYEVDLSDEAGSSEFIRSVVAKYKKIDAALLLVGGFVMGDIAATSGADLRKMFTLNFETAYYSIRPLFRHMKEMGEGRIVLVGSRHAISPKDGKAMIAYALSKSLLFSLAACLNEEAKGSNVVTTVIVPSTLDTQVNRDSMPGKDPSKWVKPQEVAEIMKFVCSGTSEVLRETILKVYNNS